MPVGTRKPHCAVRASREIHRWRQARKDIDHLMTRCVHSDFLFSVVPERWWCINSNQVKHRAICSYLVKKHIPHAHCESHRELLQRWKPSPSTEEAKATSAPEEKQIIEPKGQVLRFQNPHAHAGLISLCFIKPTEVVTGFHFPHLNLPSIIPCKYFCTS